MQENKYAFSCLTALIVAENAQLRALLHALLNSFGFKLALEAASGEDGVAQIREKRPDFVLCDLTMSPMGSLAFTRHLRQAEDSPNPYIPVVILTGSTSRQTIEAVRDAGATEIIAKPVTAQKLLAKIIEIVERPRPFVRSAEYFGPDRRRRRDASYQGPWRRKEDEAQTGTCG
jgi:two-component system, chemotaxis family, chemotaxis protein CheY